MLDFTLGRSQSNVEYDRFFSTMQPRDIDLPFPYDRVRSLVSAIPQSNRAWAFDIQVALILHQELPLSAPLSSNQEFWWRMNLEVAPRIISWRWEIDSSNYMEQAKRSHVFHPTRNYLGSLWWLAHLACGSGDTLDILRKRLSAMTTDTPVTVVERPGGGYDRELIYAILSKLYGQARQASSQDTLRRIMKMNSAWLESIIPSLAPGGIEMYVNTLFEKSGATR